MEKVLGETKNADQSELLGLVDSEKTIRVSIRKVKEILDKIFRPTPEDDLNSMDQVGLVVLLRIAISNQVGLDVERIDRETGLIESIKALCKMTLAETGKQ